jgi:hypothetical protein
MRRATGFNGAFLIVEGSSDSRFFSKFVDSALSEIIPAESSDSKNDVIRVIEILNNTNFIGVIAVVDSDFDRLECSLESIANLFYTYTHDIETMLLASPALNHVLIEYGSKDKLRNQGDIRSILLKTGIPIGCLRWISLKQQLSLDFDNLTFSKFIDKKTLDIDTKKLIEEVKNKTPKNKSTVDEILESIKGILSQEYDPWQVCCGHDLVCILALGLKSLFGTNDTNEVKPEKIESSLRLAYDYSVLKSTMLYKDIMEWEENNNSYKIFKPAMMDNNV